MARVARGGGIDQPSLQRIDTDIGADIISGLYASTFAAISPDGSRLIYTIRAPSGKPMFAMRLMDKTRGTPMAGTEGGHDPFFSPDGQWLGFFAESKLKKISVNGGAPVDLAEASNPRGASWGEDSTIVAALINTAGLFRVSADGGGAVPQQLTNLNAGESTHRWPQVLPGGQVALFTASDNLSDYENANVEMVNLKTGERKVVQTGAYFGRLTPTGHLLYVHNGIVFAEAMAGASSPVKDMGALKPQGSPVPVVDDVASLPSSGAGQFDFSKNGLFIYESGKSSPDMWSLVGWNGASGAIEFGANSSRGQTQISKPAPYFTPRFSPDGKRLAMGIETKGLDIYVYDFQSDVMIPAHFYRAVELQPGVDAGWQAHRVSDRLRQRSRADVDSQ
jgi:Tol biopolymer transport system component